MPDDSKPYPDDPEAVQPHQESREWTSPVMKKQGSINCNFIGNPNPPSVEISKAPPPLPKPEK